MRTRRSRKQKQPTRNAKERHKITRACAAFSQRAGDKQQLWESMTQYLPYKVSQRLDARGNLRAVADKSNNKQSIEREDLMTRIVRRGADEKVRAVNTTPVSGACVVHVRRRPEGMRLAARRERGQITISQSRLNGTKAFRNEALFSYLTVQ